MRFKGEDARPRGRSFGIGEEMSGWGREPQAPAWTTEPFYASADSAPAGYAVKRSVWVAPAFLAVLTAASFGVALAAGALTHAYAGLLGSLTRKHADTAGATLSVRPFVLVLLALLAVFAVGPARSRVRLALAGLGVYAALTLAADVGLTFGRPLGAPEALSTAGGVIAAVLALAAVVLVIFTQYTLPPGVHVPTVVGRRWPRTTLFGAALIVGALITIELEGWRAHLPEPLDARAVAALVSSAFILVVAVQLILFVVGSLRSRPVRQRGETPSVAFLVPAYNEEHSVDDVIWALDGAASHYDGSCRLYLVDNGSPDRTVEVAREALGTCVALEGEVLSCPARGKSNALNYGLAQTTEEIVIRVDADTIVPRTLLTDVVPYFSRPEVGGVSGIPVPRADTPRMLAGLRSIEVYYAVTFLRTGQSAVDAALVMPGNMSAYRGEVARGLGFAVGFNGEDTDIAVRIGRLGYRIVTDPAIQFRTEVPASAGHLMEQRRRWSRGMFYVAARNKSSMVMGQGLRGVLLLPWAALGACRRALTIPLMVCVATASIVDPTLLTLRQVAVIGGVIVGAHLLVVVALLLVRGRFDILVFVPLYVLFRVFKLYVAFDALLTLEVKAPPEPERELHPAWGWR